MLPKKEKLEVLYARGVKAGTKQYLADLAQSSGYGVGELIDLSITLLKNKYDKKRKTRKN